VDGMPNGDATYFTMSAPRYLALWLGLQHIGHDGVAARIQHSLNLVFIDFQLFFHCCKFLTMILMQ